MDIAQCRAFILFVLVLEKWYKTNETTLKQRQNQMDILFDQNWRINKVIKSNEELSFILKKNSTKHIVYY